jgi:hypothetical protein
VPELRSVLHVLGGCSRYEPAPGLMASTIILTYNHQITWTIISTTAQRILQPRDPARTCSACGTATYASSGSPAKQGWTGCVRRVPPTLTSAGQRHLTHLIC